MIPSPQPTTSRPPLAQARIVGLVIAVAAAGFCVSFALDAKRLHNDFCDWIVARPMSLSVDFSRPGRIETPFLQTCSSSHGEDVLLEVEPDLPGNFEKHGLLGDLASAVTIIDADGRTVETAKIGPATIFRAADSGPIG